MKISQILQWYFAMTNCEYPAAPQDSAGRKTFGLVQDMIAAHVSTHGLRFRTVGDFLQACMFGYDEPLAGDALTLLPEFWNMAKQQWPKRRFKTKRVWPRKQLAAA